jgi:hypothetical protein
METIQSWIPVGAATFFVGAFFRQYILQVKKFLKEEKEKEYNQIGDIPGRKYHALYYKLGQMENTVLDLQDQYHALAKKINDVVLKDTPRPVCPPISLDAIYNASPSKNKHHTGLMRPTTTGVKFDEESFCFLQKDNL